MGLTELIVRRTSGKILVIPAKVNLRPFKAIVGTAAMITLIKEALFPDLLCGCEVVRLKGIGSQPVIGKLVRNTKITVGKNIIL